MYFHVPFAFSKHSLYCSFSSCHKVHPNPRSSIKPFLSVGVFLFQVRVDICCLGLTQLRVEQKRNVRLVNGHSFPWLLLGILHSVFHLIHIALKGWGTIMHVVEVKNLGPVEFQFLSQGLSGRKQQNTDSNLSFAPKPVFFCTQVPFPICLSISSCHLSARKDSIMRICICLGSCHIGDHIMGLNSAFSSCVTQMQ